MNNLDLKRFHVTYFEVGVCGVIQIFFLIISFNYYVLIYVICIFCDILATDFGHDAVCITPFPDDRLYIYIHVSNWTCKVEHI